MDNTQNQQIINFSDPIPTGETERQYYFMARARQYVEELAAQLRRIPTCCVTTFGCQMNLASEN